MQENPQLEVLKDNGKLTLPPRLIFFDGVCNLCDGFVRFVIERDSARQFRFASLQSSIAQVVLSDAAHALSSVVYLETLGSGPPNVFRKSEAAIRILSQLGGVYSVLCLFLLLPTGLRDGVYDLIASLRYKIWGKKSQCRIPSAEEKALFLEWTSVL